MRTLLAYLLLTTLAVAQTSNVPKTSTVQIAIDNLDTPVTEMRPLPVAQSLTVFDLVALGKSDTFGFVGKFGRNGEIDNSPATYPEDVWHGGGDYTGQPATGSPETVEVSSSDADDNSSGNGAQTIRIFGLKSSTSTKYESEDISMSGVSWVASTNTWWRVNRMYVLTAGSSAAAEGDITCRHTTTTTNVMAVMPAGYNQTQILAWTVPSGCQGLIKAVRVGISRLSGAAGSANVTLRARTPGGVYRALRNYEVTTSSPAFYNSPEGIVVPAGTDIKVRVESVSDNDTVAEGSMDIYTVRN